MAIPLKFIQPQNPYNSFNRSNRFKSPEFPLLLFCQIYSFFRFQQVDKKVAGVAELLLREFFGSCGLHEHGTGSSG